MKKAVITTAVGIASAIAFGAAHAGDNPFAVKDLGKGYQVAADDKAKDAKCGGDKAKEKKAMDQSKEKAKDAACGGNKK